MTAEEQFAAIWATFAERAEIGRRTDERLEAITQKHEAIAQKK